MKKLLLHFAIAIAAFGAHIVAEGDLPPDHAAIRHYRCNNNGSCAAVAESSDGSQHLYVKTADDLAWRLIGRAEQFGGAGSKYFAPNSRAILDAWRGVLIVTDEDVVFTTISPSSDQKTWSDSSGWTAALNGGTPRRIVAVGDRLWLYRNGRDSFADVAGMAGLYPSFDRKSFTATIRFTDETWAAVIIPKNGGRAAAIAENLPVPYLGAWLLDEKTAMVRTNGPPGRLINQRWTTDTEELYLIDLGTGTVEKLGSVTMQAFGKQPVSYGFVNADNLPGFIVNYQVGTIEYNAADEIAYYPTPRDGRVILTGSRQRYGSSFVTMADYRGDWAILSQSINPQGIVVANKVWRCHLPSSRLELIVDPTEEIGIRTPPRATLLGHKIDHTAKWLMTVASANGDMHLVIKTDENGTERYRLIMFVTPTLEIGPITATPNGRFTVRGSNIKPAGAVSEIVDQNGTPLACSFGAHKADCSAPGIPGSYRISARVAAGGNTHTTNVVVLNVAAPVLQPIIGTVRSAAGATSNIGLSGGQYASLWGSNLAPASIAATTAQLPYVLQASGQAVRVLVGGNPAPIHYASPDQINFIIPFIEGDVRIAVERGGVMSDPFPIKVTRSAPGMFSYNDVRMDGTGKPVVIAITSDDRSLPLAIDTPCATASRICIWWLTGLGPTRPAIEPGSPAPSDALARTVETPRVYMQDVRGDWHEATVLFSGLAPGFAGLYQLNIRYPEGSFRYPKVVLYQGDTVTESTVRGNVE